MNHDDPIKAARDIICDRARQRKPFVLVFQNLEHDTLLQLVDQVTAVAARYSGIQPAVELHREGCHCLAEVSFPTTPTTQENPMTQPNGNGHAGNGSNGEQKSEDREDDVVKQADALPRQHHYTQHMVDGEAARNLALRAAVNVVLAACPGSEDALRVRRRIAGSYLAMSRFVDTVVSERVRRLTSQQPRFMQIMEAMEIAYQASAKDARELISDTELDLDRLLYEGVKHLLGSEQPVNLSAEVAQLVDTAEELVQLRREHRAYDDPDDEEACNRYKEREDELLESLDTRVRRLQRARSEAANDSHP